MEYILENIDEIIENVLKHLPMKDLNKFMIINKKWYMAAKRIKQKRNRIIYTQYSNSAKGSISEHIEDHLNSASSEPNTVIAFVTDKLDKSYVHVPSSHFPRTVKKGKLSFHNYMKKLWPKSCSYVEIISDGIIATDWTSDNIQEYENSEAASILMIPKRSDLSIEIKLPCLNKQMFEDNSCNMSDDDEENKTNNYGKYDLEDKNIYQNLVFSDDNNEDEDGHNYESLNNFAASTYSMKKDEVSSIEPQQVKMATEGLSMEPKLILFFYDELRASIPRTFCKHYKCVVAGCHVDRISLGDKYTTSIALIFRGGPNVHCASMVLTIFCRKPKSIEMELKKFMPFLKEKLGGVQKDKIPSSRSGVQLDFDVSKYSNRIIGFMFPCVARGHQFYKGRPNVESSIFKKIFPGVPLFGLFGYGEVGVNILNQDDLNEKVNGNYRGDGRDDDDENDAFFKTNSTIFVLLVM